MAPSPTVAAIGSSANRSGKAWVRGPGDADHLFGWRLLSIDAKLNPGLAWALGFGPAPQAWPGGAAILALVSRAGR